jgi:hypothetical protein
MSMSNSLPPAGWYPDPEGSFRQRWWSGANWTNDFAQYRPTQIQASPPDILAQLRQQPAQVQAPTTPEQPMPAAAQYVEPSAQAAAYRSNPQTPPQLPSAMREHGAVGTLVRDPQPATVTEQQLTGLQQAEQSRPTAPAVAAPVAPAVSIVPLSPTASPAALAVNPNMMSSYEPFGRQSWAGSNKRLRADVQYTTASWFVALVPALTVATVSAMALLVPLLATWFVYAVIVGVWLVAGFVLAVLDSKTLRLDNHIHTASPVWALLTPVPYLIARSVRVTGETGKQAHWPLVVLIVTSAAASAALVLAPGLIEIILASPLS